MKHVQLFNVSPAIPETIRFVEDLARNFWWSWNAPAGELFQRMDSGLWDAMGRNPTRFLSALPQKRFEALARDKSFVAHLERVRTQFSEEVGTPGSVADPAQRTIAYFSLEFGIHESMRIYSGGLGVLAGDHLKAASDLDIPLVAIGLFYRQGYFQQHLNQDGWQQEHYVENQIEHLPLSRARDLEGQDVRISVPLPEGNVEAVVWRMDVGRIPLFLLDTNIPENAPEFQRITDQLYGGDRRHRLRQELVLGIGGYRALLAMGVHPKCCHLNEGHAAFVSLARIADHMNRTGLPLDAVVEALPRCSVFTTHTPVPAGNESFPIDLVRPHLQALQHEMGLDPSLVISWGLPPTPDNWHEFSMTIFGLRMATYANGVSKLHGDVARRMWQMLWPGRPTDEVPIGHVTNGVHVASWVSAENEGLFDRYLGPAWKEHPTSEEVRENVNHIPSGELWRTHEVCRARLVSAARAWMERQSGERNAPRDIIEQCRSALDPNILTIGFARRFATYKRGAMLLRDPERLEALISNSERPVQFLFAGKAHPQDDQGKHLIQQLIEFSRRPSVAGRIVFIENYDISVARYMVQGVDVWLNNPRRPHEASGTSGMKACMNGALHLSILDGWWCEGYSKDCGWAIGNGEEYDDPDYQDAVESQALYNLLENEVVPTFYNRNGGGLSEAWIGMMRASIRMALGMFPSRRMIGEYADNYYSHALEAYDSLLANDGARVKDLVVRRQRLQHLWGNIRLDMPAADRDMSNVHVGDTFTVSVRAHLGELTPDEVEVQVYYGPVSTTNEITCSHVRTMSKIAEEGKGVFRYEQEVSCEATGRFGFTARVVPVGTDFQSALPGFMTWADSVA